MLVALTEKPVAGPEVPMPKLPPREVRVEVAEPVPKKISPPVTYRSVTSVLSEAF